MIEFKSIAPSALRTSEPFKTLMPFDMRVVELLAKSMKKDGFDYSTPIVVWKGHNNTVIDGHLRLAAALTAGIPQVWIYEKEFDSENDAIEYAIHTNTARDSLSEQEIEDQYTVLQYKRLAESTSRLGRKLRITTMEVSL
jgi:ParB-like chromosome segregation protein Spo0J